MNPLMQQSFSVCQYSQCKSPFSRDARTIDIPKNLMSMKKSAAASSESLRIRRTVDREPQSRRKSASKSKTIDICHSNYKRLSIQRDPIGKDSTGVLYFMDID